VAVRKKQPTGAGTAARIWSSLQQWLGGEQHATVGFSMLRIFFGVAMLVALVPSFADRHYVWGVGSWWVEPDAELRGWWEPFRLVFSKESTFWFDVAYFTLLALVVVFILGFKTRWVAPVLLLFWVGLASNNPMLTDGGDALMRIVLLFAVFANLSEHLSIDSWLMQRARARGVIREDRFAWIKTWLHNTALILCAYQILLVYAASSLFKLQGAEWLDGSALYYALSLNEFRVFPALSSLITESTGIVMLGTWAALGVQLLFPLALFWKPSRYAALALITLTHLGIGTLLGIWSFSLAMIAVDLLLVRDASWFRAWNFALRTARTARRRWGVRFPRSGRVQPALRMQR
jgi:hypothetical protein